MFMNSIPQQIEYFSYAKNHTQKICLSKTQNNKNPTTEIQWNSPQNFQIKLKLNFWMKQKEDGKTLFFVSINSSQEFFQLLKKSEEVTTTATSNLKIFYVLFSNLQFFLSPLNSFVHLFVWKTIFRSVINLTRRRRKKYFPQNILKAFFSFPL